MLCTCLLLLALTFMKTWSEVEVLRDNGLKECVENIDSKYFGDVGYGMYVNANSSLGDLYFKFPKQGYDKHINAAFDLMSYRKSEGYVLVVNETNLNIVLSGLNKTYDWNSRGKFLIALSGNVHNAFHALAENFIYNVILVDVDELKLYTYFPYKYENYNQPCLDAVELGVCNDFNNSEEAFKNKLPRYWRNSTARIAIMHLYPFIIDPKEGTGLEIELVHEMAWYFQYKLQFSPILYNDWGRVYPNRSYSGAIGDAQKGIADFVIGHFHLREEERLVDFDASFYYMDDDVLWGVPRADLRSHWENIMNIFDGLTWAATMLTLLFASVLWYFMCNRIPVETQYNKKAINSIEMSLLSLIGVPVIYEPKSNTMKILYLSVMLFCLLVTTSWKSYLINSLTHESYAFQVKNVKELTKSGFTIGIYPELRDLYGQEGTEEGDWIYNHADPNLCDATHACLDRAASKKDLATLATTKMFGYLMPQRYRTKEGRDKLFIFKQVFIKDYTNQYYTKGHPVFPASTDFLMWFRTSGFSKNLEKRLYHTMALKFRAKVKLTFKIKVLGMKEMLPSLFILGGGCCLSVVVFVLESFYYKYRDEDIKKYE